MGTHCTALTTLLQVGGKVHLVGLCDVSVIYSAFFAGRPELSEVCRTGWQTRNSLNEIPVWALTHGAPALLTQSPRGPLQASLWESSHGSLATKNAPCPGLRTQAAQFYRGWTPPARAL